MINKGTSKVDHHKLYYQKKKLRQLNTVHSVVSIEHLEKVPVK